LKRLSSFGIEQLPDPAKRVRPQAGAIIQVLSSKLATIAGRLEYSRERAHAQGAGQKSTSDRGRYVEKLNNSY
jgi:hypothetical protein